MVGGGLIQLVAYGAQDAWLSHPVSTFFKTTHRRHASFTVDGIEIYYKTCNITMSFRKYTNFDIIFDDVTINKEVYYASNLIHILSINLQHLNCKSILVNSKEIIHQDKLKLDAILKKEKKNEKEIEKEEKKKEQSHNNYCLNFFSNSFRSRDADRRAQQLAQNRQLKNQVKNLTKRR